MFPDTGDMACADDSDNILSAGLSYLLGKVNITLVDEAFFDFRKRFDRFRKKTFCVF